MNDEMDVRMTRWAMTPDSLYKKTAISLLKQGSYTKQQLLTKMMSELSPYPGEYDEEETRMLNWLDKEIEKKTFTMCGDWMAYYKPEWEKLKFDDLLIDNAFMHLHNALIPKAKIEFQDMDSFKIAHTKKYPKDEPKENFAIEVSFLPDQHWSSHAVAKTPFLLKYLKDMGLEYRVRTFQNGDEVEEIECLTLSEEAKSNGMTCSGICGEFNEYGEPNQANGTFVCYSCRSR